MPTLWQKIKVWTKVVIFSLILIYILIFIIKNSGQHIQFWYWFGTPLQSSLLLFTFCTFVAGAIFALIFRTTYRTVAQVRELYASRKESAELKTEAAKIESPLPLSPPPATTSTTELKP